MAPLVQIGISMGDPCGIGPEVGLKSASWAHREPGIHPVLVGSESVFQRDIDRYHLPVKLSDEEDASSLDTITLIVPEDVDDSEFAYGNPSAESGRASYASILRGVDLVKEGTLDAIVTAPISKLAFELAGLDYPGHTELLAKLTRAHRYCMMLVADRLRVALVTTHTAISSVAQQITRNAVFDKIELCSIFLKHFMKLLSPTIGVCALNPHAGESGRFGSEEREIEEAIRDARKIGVKAEGPFPADSLFAFWQKYDCIIANYHDQGLIPIKMLAFQKSVNVTLGLPLVRTSPDHGTAYNIAGEGRANPDSMIEAIKLAHSMVLAGRAQWRE